MRRVLVEAVDREVGGTATAAKDYFSEIMVGKLGPILCKCKKANPSARLFYKIVN